MDKLAQFLVDLSGAVPKLFELWGLLGSRDAFLASLDTTLELARARHDEELKRKHGR